MSFLQPRKDKQMNDNYNFCYTADTNALLRNDSPDSVRNYFILYSIKCLITLKCFYKCCVL